MCSDTTRIRLESAIPKRILSLDLPCCCIVQLLEGSMMVLHLSGSHFLTLDGFYLGCGQTEREPIVPSIWLFHS